MWKIRVSVLIFIFVVVISICDAKVNFKYDDYNVVETSFNRFELTFYSDSKYSDDDIQIDIEKSGEKSDNIVIDSVEHYGEMYILSGHLQNYSVKSNKLFNPWFNTSWKYRTTNSIANGTRPYQLRVNVQNTSGVNTDMNVYTSGNCESINCSEIVFVVNDIVVPHWIESNITSSSGTIWVNITINGTVEMYYGRGNYTASSSGEGTFPHYTNTPPPHPGTFSITTNKVLVGKFSYITSGTDQFGMYTGDLATPRIAIYPYTPYTPDVTVLYDSTEIAFTPALNIPTGVHIWEIGRNGTTDSFTQYDYGYKTTIPYVGVTAKTVQSRGLASFYYAFVREYIYPEPHWLVWGGETTPTQTYMKSRYTYNISGDTIGGISSSCIELQSSGGIYWKMTATDDGMAFSEGRC